MKELLLGRFALVLTVVVAASLSPIKTIAASSTDETSALKLQIGRLRAENAALRTTLCSEVFRARLCNPDRKQWPGCL